MLINYKSNADKLINRKSNKRQENEGRMVLEIMTGSGSDNDWLLV